jgi:hypothetical protein
VCGVITGVKWFNFKKGTFFTGFVNEVVSMNEQLYLRRVKTHDSNITEKPVALIYNIYKVINSTYTNYIQLTDHNNNSKRSMPL